LRFSSFAPPADAVVVDMDSPLVAGHSNVAAGDGSEIGAPGQPRRPCATSRDFNQHRTGRRGGANAKK
jgi:hypothetical protein